MIHLIIAIWVENKALAFFENFTDMIFDYIRFKIPSMKRLLSFSLFLSLALILPLSGSAQSSYCTPKYSGNGNPTTSEPTPFYTHFLRVSMANIDRRTAEPTSVFQNQIYNDFTKTDTLRLTQTAKYPLNIELGNGANTQTFAVWIDYNQNGVFESTERVATRTDVANVGDHTYNVSVTIPKASKLGYTRMRVATLYGTKIPDPCNNSRADNFPALIADWSQHFQDYTVEIVKPNIQLFESVSISHPTFNEVELGSVNNEILRIDVETNDDGTISPLNVDSFFFSLLGSSDEKDIKKATLYYTGKNTQFNTNNLQDSVSNPSTDFTLTSKVNLKPGVNYFWLAYDISKKALLTNRVDARCNGIFAVTKRIPSIIAPGGDRPVGYCNSRGNRSMFVYVRRVQINTINVFSFWANSGYTNNTFRSTNIERGDSVDLTVDVGNSVNNSFTKAWIDFNADGDFDDANEEIMFDSITTTGTTPTFGPVTVKFKVPNNAKIGPTRLRVTSASKADVFPWKAPPQACDKVVEIGEVEDYTVIISSDGEPVSNFRATTACVGDSTRFTDNSNTFNPTFYQITSWKWDFGDGKTSTDQNPKHLYANPGTYKVSLVVNTNKPGTPDTMTRVVVVEDPKVDFSLSTTLSKTDIGFTDQTKGATTVFWEWTFDDPTSPNNISYIPTPTHNYSSKGTYNIKLIVNTIGGCIDSVIKSVKIVDELKPVANYNAGNFEPYRTAPIKFVDLSVNRPNKWTWKVRPSSHSFVNGTSSSDQNPEITFNNLATYTVTLIAENNAGLDSISRTFKTKNYTKPTTDFVANQVQVKAGQIVSFSDLTTNDPTKWEWVFGDGDSSATGDPLHEYDLTGKYTVKLTASNPAGSSSETKIDYIEVSDEYVMCESDVKGSPLFKGTLFDSGGDNQDYQSSEECSFVIRPECAGPITLAFSEFDLASGDYVRVFDYNEAKGIRIPLHSGVGFTGSTKPATLKATLGAVLVEMVSNATGEAPGFKLIWSAAPNIKPQARIKGDTIGYVNSALFLENGTAIGTDNRYYWDVDNDGIIDDSTSRKVNVLFDKKGLDTVVLIAVNCKGIDTAYHIVKVDSATKVPKAKFVATDSVIFTNDEVRLLDLSTQGPNKWEWEVSGDPFNYLFVNGTEDTSRNPEIIFFEPGYYTISLTASNGLGSSKKLVKTNHILVQTRRSMCLFPYNDKSPAGRLTDDGGEDTVYFSRDCEFKLKPCAKEVILNVRMFDYRAGDYLRIYDGEDNSGTPFHTGLGFTATDNPQGKTFVAKSGAVYFEHDATGFNTSSEGFVIDWSTISYADPDIDFEAADTAYTGGNVVFFFNKTDENANPHVKYRWDLDNDGSVEDTLFNTSYSYKTVGTYKAELSVRACNFSDSIYRTIKVIKPKGKPRARFNTSQTRVATTDIVTFTDQSTNGPSKWEWIFNPMYDTTFSGTDTILNPLFTVMGGSDTLPRFAVTFNRPDTYDVYLVVSNSFGVDTILKKQHIVAFEYCQPSISNTPVPELGITYFELGDIKNSSTNGVDVYTDFSRTASTRITRGGTEVVKVSRGSSSPNINIKVWIDYNQDGDFTDSDEEAVYITSSDSVNFTRKIKVPKTALTGPTRLRVGSSLAADGNDPCGPNRFGEFEDYKVIVGEDDIKPVITLIGPSLVFVELSYPYKDSGATAFDNVDGDITSKIVTVNPVDVNKEGLYKVTYNVKDSANNEAVEVVRQVVVGGDETPPVITLLGDNPFEMDVFTEYKDPGATALDNIDGDVTSLIAIEVKVDTFRVGEYKVYYTAYDNSGNASATVERDVHVLDRVAPVITLRGPANITIIQGKDTYTEDSADVDDNYYDDVDLIIAGDVVNENVVGTYVITYDATDRSGNTATQVTRTVVVEKDDAIGEIPGLNNFSIYPTPATDLVYLSFDVNKDIEGSFRIVDALGHEIYTRDVSITGETKFEVSVSDLPGGVYFVELTSDDYTTAKSFTIVR